MRAGVMSAVAVCLSSALSGAGPAPIIDEGFEAGIPTNWVTINHAAPLAPGGDPTDWGRSFFGPNGQFAAHAGTYFAEARDSSTDPEGTVDDWLLTPPLQIRAGDKLSFWSRAAGHNSDNLQVRLSTAADSLDCGATNAVPPPIAPPDPPEFAAYRAAVEANVGAFTNLLINIDPTTGNTYPAVTCSNDYPTAWTKYEYTFKAAAEGRIGFRYVAYDGGGSGGNSWVIGVDEVRVAGPPVIGTVISVRAIPRENQE